MDECQLQEGYPFAKLKQDRQIVRMSQEVRSENSSSSTLLIVGPVTMTNYNKNVAKTILKIFSNFSGYLGNHKHSVTQLLGFAVN